MVLRDIVVVGAAASLSGCLALSSPEYDEPEQTQPMLLAAAAYPDLVQPILVTDELFLEFAGAVLSEDNGVAVQLALYLDYGHPDPIERPFVAVSYPFAPIPPGTLAQGPRPFSSIRWYLEVRDIPSGCHTMMLMASHAFNPDTVCPVDLSDSSFLVWQVIRCDADDPSCVTDCKQLQCPQGKCRTCAAMGAR